MIERQFVLRNKKQFEIQNYLFESLRRAGLSYVEIKRTPLGERIIIHTTRPGLVVGRSGSNIKKITSELKSRFKLENPQVEIAEVKDPNLDPKVVAEKIILSLERYGSKRFKAILHKTMEEVMNSGALGVEIILSGKVPSARAKSWRVSVGYLRKCGDVAIEGIRRAHRQARLKSGIVGVKVSITPPDLDLIDKIDLSQLNKSVEHAEVKEVEEKQQSGNEDKEPSGEKKASKGKETESKVEKEAKKPKKPKSKSSKSTKKKSSKSQK